MILVQHESYAQLVSPLPTGTMSYEKLEELLCLRDTVAYAARPREPGYVFYCDAILARSREYRADIAESRRQGWPKPWDASCRYQCVLPFVNQFKISRAHGYHPLGDVSSFRLHARAKANPRFGSCSSCCSRPPVRPSLKHSTLADIPCR